MSFVCRTSSKLRPALSRGFAAGKDVRFGIDARNAMLAGVDKLREGREKPFDTDSRHVHELPRHEGWDASKDRGSTPKKSLGQSFCDDGKVRAKKKSEARGR